MSRGWRSHFRDVIARLLLSSGVTQPVRRLRGNLSILTFHRVLPEAKRAAYPLPGLAVTPEELEWLLSGFERHFRCGTLGESIRSWEQEPDAKRPSLAITFDDGQLDNWRYARPVLDRLGMKATFFVPVDSVLDGNPLWHDRIAWAVQRATALHPLEAARLALDFVPPGQDALPGPRGMVVLAKALPADERNLYLESWEKLAGELTRPDWDGFMGWDQLRSLAESGHEVGSHSMSHAILPLCTGQEIDSEIRESRRILETRLDTAIDSFCYPNGDCDSRCVDSVRDAGYAQAVTTAWGSNRSNASRFELRRFDMTSEHSLDARGRLSEARLAWRISGMHPGLD